MVGERRRDLHRRSVDCGRQRLECDLGLEAPVVAEPVRRRKVRKVSGCRCWRKSERRRFGRLKHATVYGAYSTWCTRSNMSAALSLTGCLRHVANGSTRSVVSASEGEGSTSSRASTRSGDTLYRAHGNVDGERLVLHEGVQQCHGKRNADDGIEMRASKKDRRRSTALRPFDVDID